MRVLLDANILISYLLTPQGRGGSTIIVEAALAEEFIIVVPTQLINEVRRKVTTGRLASRIGSADLRLLLELLQEVGEVLPPITEIESYTRDRKDDYLIACALANRVDFIVSMDKDLLTLGSLKTVRIVSPGEFLAILRSSQ